MPNGQPMTPEEVQMQLQSQLGQGASFADRLRDERTAYTQNVQNFIGQTTPQDQFTGASGVPLQPSRVSAQNEALLRAVGSAGAQYSPQLELAARSQDQDLLGQIAQLAASRQQGVGDVSTGGLDSIKELLGVRKSLVEAGLDTSAIDSQLGSLGQAAPKTTSEAQGVVDVIDSILGSDTDPITGDLRLGGIPLLNRTDVEKTKGNIERLKSMLTVEERGKLKGQGTITDTETKLLADAVANLNPKMSDEDFRVELNRIKSVFLNKPGVASQFGSNEQGVVGATAPGGYVIEEVK